MRRQLIQPYLFLLGMGLILSSCFNEPNYSDVPAIDFKGIDRYTIAAGRGVGQGKRDSVVITIGFKDGQGDLGIGLPPSNADTLRYKSNGGWGNYQIKTFRLVNRQYQEVLLSVNNALYFPELTKGKPRGAIEGTLDFTQIFQYGTSYRLFPTKFQIKIRDRALQESNVIETDTITLPYYEN
ncbi:hypothetical protein [Spirosoma validum]|uniref:Lipoprotein n=1 Tax=Spirosoma validum TaxID=2771355 RepID=A0A927GC88_9BACT|nr:hypothetical protein [Spirosoma validum]MBD2752409.1 hypothetical protein [Spirosoma validum]